MRLEPAILGLWIQHYTTVLWCKLLAQVQQCLAQLFGSARTTTIPILRLVWPVLVKSGMSWYGLGWHKPCQVKKFKGNLDLTWPYLDCHGLVWSGLSWSGLAWSGMAWDGHAKSLPRAQNTRSNCVTRTSLAWPDLVWPDLAWSGLAWTGLAWFSLSWPGLGFKLAVIRSEQKTGWQPTKLTTTQILGNLSLAGLCLAGLGWGLTELSNGLVI